MTGSDSSRKSKFELVVDELALGIELLGRRKQSAFFAACGDGLLPLYKKFQDQTKWGDATPLREALNTAWAYAMGALNSAENDILLNLKNVTPHSDDFDTILVTYAQDAVICVDCSVRPAINDNLLDPECVWYALEPVNRHLMLNKSGFYDLGDHDLARELEDRIVEEPKMRMAIEFCKSSISILKSETNVNASTMANLRRNASALRPE